MYLLDLLVRFTFLFCLKVIVQHQMYHTIYFPLFNKMLFLHELISFPFSSSSSFAISTFLLSLVDVRVQTLLMQKRMVAI